MMKPNKNNKESNNIDLFGKMLEIGVGSIFLIIFVGIILGNIFPEKEEKIINIMTGSIVLLIAIGLFIYIGKRIKSLKHSKSLIEKIIIIIMPIAVIITFIGAIMLGIYNQNKKDGVDFVKVVDVNNGKIVIDGSNYYHGDYKTIEINKPIFLKVNKGDMISVKHQEKPEGLKYVWNVSEEAGTTVTVLGGPLLQMLFIIDLILSSLNYFVKNENDENNINEE